MNCKILKTFLTTIYEEFLELVNFFIVILIKNQLSTHYNIFKKLIFDAKYSLNFFFEIVAERKYEIGKYSIVVM